ncbi:MAG TPA: phytanoyl-CoA dioxygenase family protein [Sandaracinaceae bacterium LLY-WYZ-13_1]|nr:phytanoyl-CoA dioxygenase family protein [Sandaracinaceae bacterium LLY-WYZ-13_1]
MGAIDGHLDGVREGRVFGWAWDPRDASARVEIEVRVDGSPLGRVAAEKPRPDLREAGIGDGQHGFELEVPEPFVDGRFHRVEACHGDGRPLAGSPWRGRIGAEADEAPRFRSRFGGLWTDVSNAPEVIAGQRALGWLDPEEGALLEAWVRDGYVILRDAVDRATVDALRRGVEAVWDGGAPGVWAEVHGADGLRFEPARPAHRRERTKLLDLHAHLDAARRAAFARPLRRFLHRVFSRPALAFQSLYFERGVEQPLHRDTAYVRVSSPVEMVAAWIALEPIRAGSGELELYAGSHELPEELFDGSKWMPRPWDQLAPQEYSAQLRRRCEAAGLRYERFIARPGDVLIWAADLVHGGSRDPDPALTRRSLVVHYCPTSAYPIYDGPSGPRREHAPGCSYTFALRGDDRTS